MVAEVPPKRQNIEKLNIGQRIYVPRDFSRVSCSNVKHMIRKIGERSNEVARTNPRRTDDSPMWARIINCHLRPHPWSDHSIDCSGFDRIEIVTNDLGCYPWLLEDRIINPHEDIDVGVQLGSSAHPLESLVTNNV